MSRSPNWCFTLNNYTEEDIERLHNLECVYIIVGEEVAPKTGTPHLQGYVEFKDKPVLSTVKKRIGATAHLEVAKGFAHQNIQYCSKGGKPWMKGEPKQPGKRTDLDKIAKEIIEGKAVDKVALENPMAFHMYGRTMSKIEDIALRKRFRTEMTTCEWLWGPTGVGKSHKAFEGFNPETHYVWKNDNGWQDGYTGQETVIINEFRGDIKFSELLQLIDKWPYELRRRGREPVPFLAKHIIITSSLPPEGVYKNLAAEDKLDQLLRRVKITHLEAMSGGVSGGGLGNTEPDPRTKNEGKQEMTDKEFDAFMKNI